jgi:hypothetical protein
MNATQSTTFEKGKSKDLVYLSPLASSGNASPTWRKGNQAHDLHPRFCNG